MKHTNNRSDSVQHLQHLCAPPLQGLSGISAFCKTGVFSQLNVAYLQPEKLNGKTNVY